MSFESTLTDLLEPLVNGNVFWNSTPQGFKYNVPFIILQQIGGKSGWYLESALPSHKHARMQINTNGRRLQDCCDLARLVEKTICESAFVAEPYGAFISGYEEAISLYECRQDFGFWYPDI
jgi:hypothetical protein